MRILLGRSYPIHIQGAHVIAKCKEDSFINHRNPFSLNKVMTLADIFEAQVGRICVRKHPPICHRLGR